MMQTYAASRQVNAPNVGSFFLLILTAILLGVSWPIGKLALIEIDPWTLRAVTTIGPGVILLAYTRISGQVLWPKKTDFLAIAVTAFFNITAWNILSAFGLRASDATHAVIIIYTMPIWATMLSAWLIVEPVTHRSMLALALMVMSLIVLVGGNMNEVANNPDGLALLLLAAMIWAYGTIRQKKLKTDLGLSAVAGWQLTLGAVPMIVGILFWGTPGDFVNASFTALAAVSYSLISKAFIFWLWLRVIEIFPAHIASIGTAATPVFGVLASAVILGEALGVEELGALMFVVAGLLVLALPRRLATDDSKIVGKIRTAS